MLRFRPLRRIAPGVMALSLGIAVVAQADDRHVLAAATETCKQALDKQSIIASCSMVIALGSDPRLLERAYNRRGLANEATGQFNGAVNDFSSVIKLNPRIAGYFNNRMRAYKALGLLNLALADADKAVAMAPGYPFVFHGRGAVHYDRGEYLPAIADYGAALAFNRSDASLLVDRGRAFMKLGQPKNAIRDFSEAHEVDASFTPALSERGLAWASLGDAAQARPDLQAALAVDPGDDKAAAALRSLEAAPSQAVLQRIDDAGPSQETERAEAEARRAVQERDDAEKARLEAQQRLKDERLTRARTDAQRVRGNASDFVKANRDDPQLLDHLQRIADLGAALPGTEPGPIEHATSVLSAGLAADPVYAAYVARRKTELARDDQRTLGDALAILRTQKDFLVGQVVQDPTGDQAPAFLSLAKQVDAVLAAPELARAQTVMGTIDAAIARAKMTDRYEAARRAAPAELPDKGDPQPSR